MELKEGMYVRTKKLLNYDYVTITKIKHIEEKETCLHIWLEDKDLITEKYIIKASYNIIDLIEEGDYVNGFEVMEADWNNDDLEYEEGLAIPMYSSDDLDVIENWQPLKYMKIKSIVTKEQFESMSYRIGE